MHHLLSSLTVRSVGDIVAGIWAIMLMMQVGLFDVLMRFVEPSSKDIFYSCIRRQLFFVMHY